jgi:hypothetical protein
VERDTASARVEGSDRKGGRGGGGEGAEGGGRRRERRTAWQRERDLSQDVVVSSRYSGKRFGDPGSRR